MRRAATCLNPYCGDWLNVHRHIPLCASCRFAGKCGAALAFVVAFLWHVLAPIDGLALARLVIHVITQEFR